jgi:hypothetical protein
MEEWKADMRKVVEEHVRCKPELYCKFGRTIDEAVQLMFEIMGLKE